ncbi:hypothetical protein GT042_09040, partial [Streptomyces sp. SID3212]|nr:hypothetical protein [Streptomyces sp. SID3212]
AGRPGPVGVAAVAGALVAATGGSVLGSRWPKVPFRAAILVAGLDVALLLWQGAGPS